MACAESLVKYILFFANLFFALAGLTLLGLGIALELRVAGVTDLFEDSQLYQLTPIGAIVVGCIVFLIAFFGCYGAIRESNCMLISYSVFMIFLIILKITLVTLIFVKQDEVLSSIPGWLVEVFDEDRNGFHEIEKTFQCCGPKGPESYNTTTSIIIPIPVLPASCCHESEVICVRLIAYEGCIAVVTKFFETFGLTIGIIAIIVALIEPKRDMMKLAESDMMKLAALLSQTGVVTYGTKPLAIFVLLTQRSIISYLVAVTFGLCLASHVRHKERARY